MFWMRVFLVLRSTLYYRFGDGTRTATFKMNLPMQDEFDDLPQQPSPLERATVRKREQKKSYLACHLSRRLSRRVSF